MTTAHPSNDARAIEELRSKLGGRLTIVGHHYEQEDTIRHCDFRGDSLELARRVPGIASDYIVFCGVYFMAESAALLAREGQQVLLPDHSADCVMAQMTPARLLDRVLGRLTASGRKLVPLAYVITSLAVKAVVGRYGGAVCTSANAEKMMDWAFRQGDGVLFLPDKNLARNTARKLGITGRDTHILDVRRTGEAVDLEAADKAALVLWPGLCAIHARFHPGQIEAVRKADPSCKVIVHPECSPEVVRAADGAGSTTYIIEYVRNAPDGAHIYVGTPRPRAGRTHPCGTPAFQRLFQHGENHARKAPHHAGRHRCREHGTHHRPQRGFRSGQGVPRTHARSLRVIFDACWRRGALPDEGFPSPAPSKRGLSPSFPWRGNHAAGVPPDMLQPIECPIPNRFQGALPPPFLYAQNKVFSQKKAV